MSSDRLVLREQLVQGAQELAIDLPEPQIKNLLDYLSLLAKWNSVYNPVS